MIDALLFAVRDGIRAQNFGYSGPTLCDIQDTGKPPPRMGNLFVSVHQGSSRNTSTRNLDEYFDWNLTLTQRVQVPLDRIGDQQLASKLARIAGPRNPSFNARMEQLKCWGSMNWRITVLRSQTPASANDNILAWAPPNSGDVYGFVEPAHFVSMDRPVLVGPDWFGAEPPQNARGDSLDVGLKGELRFSGARRMQPQTAAVGPFV